MTHKELDTIAQRALYRALKDCDAVARDNARRMYEGCGIAYNPDLLQAYSLLSEIVNMQFTNRLQKISYLTAGVRKMEQAHLYNIGKVFFGNANKTNIVGFSPELKMPFTPVQDPNFYFPKWGMDILTWLVETPEDPLYLDGPTGCGKTFVLKQFFSRLNFPVYESNGHSRLEYDALVGLWSLDESNRTVFRLGNLSRAYKYGGLFLLNEWDLIPPETVAGLNTILDRSPLLLESGEYITPHPLFRFAVTANTNGSGDASGYYAGTLRANGATLSRFTKVHADYMDPDDETGALCRIFAGEYDTKFVTNLVKFAGEVRMMFTDEHADAQAISLDITVSFRDLIRTLKLYRTYGKYPDKKEAMRKALFAAVFCAASQDTQVVINELIDRRFF